MAGAAARGSRTPSSSCSPPRDAIYNYAFRRTSSWALAEDVTQARPEATDDVSEWVRAEHTMAEIREALEMLPSRQRDVVELVSWAGRTEAEAAGAPDVPVGTVKSRLSRARRNLADRRVVSA